MANSPKKPQSYKELSDKLDKNLSWFEGSDIDLDSAVDKYQETMQTLEEMEAYLKSAQNKIKKISAKFDS